MASFRGQPLTHEMAVDMLCGWLSPPPSSGLPPRQAPADIPLPSPELPFSWLVAAGKNPAYDYFPSQHQLFYRGRGSGVVW